MRERRTVTVDFGLSIQQYRRTQADTATYLECVTATMRVITHVKHKEGCADSHRYTRHSTRSRPLHCKGRGRVRVPISQIRCLDCRGVFTVLPSFVLRYQRYEVHLAQDLLEYNLIMDVSYRYQARILGNNNPELANTAPMALWRLDVLARLRDSLVAPVRCTDSVPQATVDSRPHRRLGWGRVA